MRSESIEILDIMLHFIGELEPVGAEKLDAVIRKRVMGSRDHHAKVGAHGTGEHSNRGSGDRTGQQDVHSDRGETGNQGGLDHISGKPGILADEHAMAMVTAAKDQARCLPHLQGEFRRYGAIRAPANAVGTKMFPSHVHPVRRRSFFNEKNGRFKSRCCKDDGEFETMINKTAGASQRFRWKSVQPAKYVIFSAFCRAPWEEAGLR